MVCSIVKKFGMVNYYRNRKTVKEIPIRFWLNLCKGFGILLLPQILKVPRLLSFFYFLFIILFVIHNKIAEMTGPFDFFVIHILQTLIDEYFLPA